MSYRRYLNRNIGDYIKYKYHLFSEVFSNSACLEREVIPVLTWPCRSLYINTLYSVECLWHDFSDDNLDRCNTIN